MKLRNKMLVIFGLILAIFIFSISYFSSEKAGDYLDRMSSGAYKEVLKQANATLEYRMKNYERAINTFYISDEFQELLTKEGGDKFEEYLDNKRLKDFVESLLNTYEYVPLVKVYNFNAKTFSGIIYREADIEDQSWKEEVLAGTSNGILWSIRSYDLHGEKLIRLVAAKALRNKVNKEAYGIVSLEIDPGYLFNQIKSMDLFKEGNAYVLDERGAILFRQSDRLNGSVGQSLPFVSKMSGSSGYFTETIEGEPHLVVYDKDSDGSWTIAGVTPVEGALPLSKEVRDYILALSGILLALGIIVIYVCSYLFTKRMSRLTDEMLKVSKGIFDDVQLDTKSNDEIGEMNKVFQRMMRKLNKNIDEISEMKSREFAFRMKALQAQINPHFLYNTLSTINWMAMGIGAEDISRAVNALARYYRIALSNGREIITVKEELDQVRYYVYIQQIRIKDNIAFNFQVDDEVLGYETVKMILQPIVENAIIHGIEKHNKTGVIAISVLKKGDLIVFEVKDDGCGMDRDTQTGLLSDHTLSSGYGLYNIDSKIKLYFGERFGLQIESKPGEGTKIFIVIPATFNRNEASLC
ncbi:hypothetical protein DQG23_10200 [Paenibacillus contaminans]|uniref:histidine kinase n=2 Tax=Paenibacillus contaminans TaxID=450362 RepID=A0A329MQ18_9BACL|nr:hypothetical protein DQG23_10200 [Paenibacillus contaminans]